MATIGGRLKHAWNAFTNRDDPYAPRSQPIGMVNGVRPDRTRMFIANERSIISSIYTRLSVDVAAVSIRHVRLDKTGRFLEEIDSGLNECLSVSANIDQPGRAYRQDVAMSLFDKGAVAVVAVDTTLDPTQTGGYDVQTLRVGDVVQWYPRAVKVSLYDDREGQGRREEIILPKSVVAVIENPFYAIMNEPNSTLQRLIHKLNLLDAVDEASSSGKLDIIIQLPYVIKSEARRAQAEQRRKDIEFQLKGSQYGIAYTDGTEKITQLNRPAENNLLAQIEFLTKMLYAQLGLTEEIMNGTADEAVMLNYQNRTIEPVVTAIVEAYHRTFLTKTARSQGQAVMFFRDPFKFVPIASIADIADKFTRNEILSSNEFRQIVGFKPVQDAKADELRNSNMPQSELGTLPPGMSAEADVVDDSTDEDASIMQDAFNSINGTIDEIFADLGVDE
jgi:Phage portal protein